MVTVIIIQPQAKNTQHHICHRHTHTHAHTPRQRLALCLTVTIILDREREKERELVVLYPPRPLWTCYCVLNRRGECCYGDRFHLQRQSEGCICVCVPIALRLQLLMLAVIQQTERVLQSSENLLLHLGECVQFNAAHNFRQQSPCRQAHLLT